MQTWIFIKTLRRKNCCASCSRRLGVPPTYQSSETGLCLTVQPYNTLVTDRRTTDDNPAIDVYSIAVARQKLSTKTALNSYGENS